MHIKTIASKSDLTTKKTRSATMLISTTFLYNIEKAQRLAIEGHVPEALDQTNRKATGPGHDSSTPIFLEPACALSSRKPMQKGGS
jgi:hypothetical protein